MNLFRLIPSMLMLGTALTVGASSFDFEDGQIPSGWSGWGYDEGETKVVDNPYQCGNTSKKCLKFVSENYGMIGFYGSESFSKYVMAIDVFTTIQLNVGVYVSAADANEIKISEKGKWVTLYFDFRSQGTAADASGMIYLGSKSATGTIYMDNVRFVENIGDDAVNCNDAYVSEICKKVDNYSFGTVAIGGGGYVPGIIASGKTKIARTDVGGAYKWRSSDCSWQPITNFISEENVGLYSIEAAAIDPQNEQNIYLLGGCGYSSAQKTAVMCSKDGGKTFTTVDVTNLLFVHGNGNGRNCGERIAVDPKNSDIIYCGGRLNNPLIKSADGGKTWSVVSTFPNVYTNQVNWPSWEQHSYPTTSDENGITSVVFDATTAIPAGTQRIFVGVSRTGASNLYVSEDAGNTWSPVSGLPTNFIPCRMKMDKNGDLLIAYADKSMNSTSGAIYRYNPNTQVAENISPKTDKPCAFGDVAVSPKDPKKLVACSICKWDSQKWESGKTANGDHFWTSEDGGKTWRCLDNSFTLQSNGVTWIDGYAIHWCGTLCFDPTDDSKISVGSGNGIFTCNNIWCTGNPVFYFDVNGLEETVALDMISVPGGDLMSVIGDYTGFIHKNIHEFAPIHDPALGTTGGINYCSKDPSVMMRVANIGFYYTTTGHNGWTQMNNTSYSYQNPYSQESMPSNEGKCAIMKKGNDYRYFVIPGPGVSGIYYSDNNGSAWTLVTGTEYATHIQVDPVNHKYVYAGGKGKFYMSDDYGATFTSQEMSNGDLGRITVVSGEEGLVYAPGNNCLYVSTDHGQTFTTVKDVNVCEAVGAGIGKNGTGYTLYIYGAVNDCDKGLYRSDDQGSSWIRMSKEENLYGGPGNGKFVIGDWNTYGRFYMSTVGMGIVYGEPAASATSSEWTCFEDNTECKKNVGVEEATVALQSVVTPTMFDDVFTLQATGVYVVSNPMGQIIESGTSSESTVLGSNWGRGIYFVSINGETYKVVKK